MRWFDDLAVMVTFRQTDPFYAIDLTDPFDPELLGELKIPGFSSYLHPIDGDLMIGMGSAADPTTGVTSGAKASLFDVSDLTAPRELDTVSYPAGTTAQAAPRPPPVHLAARPAYGADRDLGGLRRASPGTCPCCGSATAA